MRPTFALLTTTTSLAVALLAPAPSPAATPLPTVANLRCEYKADPIGIEAAVNLAQAVLGAHHREG